jgi:N-methylhydantoinase B
MNAVPDNRIDPITVDVISSALLSIVEEMGEALVRASFSSNIKERRDCSTALFDRHGATLCQAEHIPMHLGSFIGIIPEILKRHTAEAMRPGDVPIGNDAYAGGGTHLPDPELGLLHLSRSAGCPARRSSHALHPILIEFCAVPTRPNCLFKPQPSLSWS